MVLKNKIQIYKKMHTSNICNAKNMWRPCDVLAAVRALFIIGMRQISRSEIKKT